MDKTGRSARPAGCANETCPDRVVPAPSRRAKQSKHMKLNPKLLVSMLFLAALPLAAPAQSATATDYGSQAAADYGPRAGDREFTLGGAGGSNRKFNDSFGGANFSIGYFLNNTQEISLRQSINYSNPNLPGARQEWNGATRIAFDQHFGTGQLRPFVGVNFGGAYGKGVTDTWAAGIEAGLKYYVQPHTFVYATPEYDWSFRHASGLNHRFSSGLFNWSLGVGFDF